LILKPPARLVFRREGAKAKRRRAAAVQNAGAFYDGSRMARSVLECARPLALFGANTVSHLLPNFHQVIFRPLSEWIYPILAPRRVSNHALRLLPEFCLPCQFLASARFTTVCEFKIGRVRLCRTLTRSKWGSTESHATVDDLVGVS